MTQVTLGFQDAVLGKIAGEAIQAAVIDLPDLGSRVVQEITVVGDHHNRRSEVGQVALQPGDPLEV